MANIDDSSKTKLEEDRYFAERDREILEQHKQAESLRVERATIADIVGTNDESILVELQDLGFNPETAKLLALLPLVQVAWAEGHVTDREREIILDLARSRGVEPESEAHARIVAWITVRPRDEMFVRGIGIIGRILAARPEHASSVVMQDLIQQCTRVAAASGGFLGLTDKVSSAEEAIIARIASVLDKAKAE
ncbi:MAG: hypothetical protein ABI833_13590 [Acidobacteriota bacterium]